MVEGERPPALAGIGQVGQRPAREVVDDVDLVTLDEQPVDQGGTDEAGPARHHCAHVRISLTRYPFAVDHGSRGDHRAGAQYRHGADVAGCPTVACGPITEPSTFASAATWHPSIRTESTTAAPVSITDPGTEHAAHHACAFGDLTVVER